MHEALLDRLAPAVLKDRNDAWWSNVKASDEFLDVVFPEFYRRIGQRLDFRKADYHRLVPFMKNSDIDSEIGEVLDAIARVASRATPAGA